MTHDCHINTATCSHHSAFFLAQSANAVSFSLLRLCLQAILLHIAVTARSTAIVIVTLGGVVPGNRRSFAAMVNSIREEMTANHALLCGELGKISSRVTAMERDHTEQSLPLNVPNQPEEQSLPSTLSQTPEQSLPDATTLTERQSLLDNRDQADGAEPQQEHSQRERPPPAKDRPNWAERPEDDAPDYQEEVYWEPSDSDSLDGDTKRISATSAKIIQDAFSRSLDPSKREGSTCLDRGRWTLP